MNKWAMAWLVIMTINLIAAANLHGKQIRWSFPVTFTSTITQAFILYMAGLFN